jgi:hypothetical protein
MYRTIETSMWTDAKFRGLPAPARLLFLYLITNPHAHVSGIYYLPDVMLLHESGVKSEALNTVWDTLSKSGLARRDQNAEIVWVTNMLRYQGRGEKNEKSAAKQLESLHNSSLIQDYLNHYPEVRRHIRKPKRDRVSRPRPTCLQEQEKDQEQEGASAPVAEVGDEGTMITAETVYRAYPKHVEPEPSKKAIAEAVRYLRKSRDISTPWAWLLGKVRQYADARSAIESAHPGAKRYVPACHRWMKRKRYEEDPEVWSDEVPGFAAQKGRTNGTPKPSATQRGEFPEPQRRLKVLNADPADALAG